MRVWSRQSDKYSMGRHRLWRLGIVVPLAFILGLSGCMNLRYYTQASRGHLQLLLQREQIADLLQDEALDPQLRKRLGMVEEIRAFAFNELKLPESRSYTTFVDLDRDYVLKNLFAAPEFSVRLNTWCYPVAGCATYRGYFDERLLREHAIKLQEEGADIYIGNVGAYSTLGWFDDPLPSPVMRRSESSLIGLIFHELAHQVIYVKGDTRFNESFATAVERAGVERWYQAHNEPARIQEYYKQISGQEAAIGIISETRGRLQVLYQQAVGEGDMRRLKAQELESARQRFRSIDAELAALSGFADWFMTDLNNAKIGSVVAYHEFSGAFLGMLAEVGGEFGRFYVWVKKLAKLDTRSREQCLAALSPGGTHDAEKVPHYCESGG